MSPSAVAGKPKSKVKIYQTNALNKNKNTEIFMHRLKIERREKTQFEAVSEHLII